MNDIKVNVNATNLNSVAFQDHLTKGLGKFMGDPFKKQLPKYKPPIGIPKVPARPIRRPPSSNRLS